MGLALPGQIRAGARALEEVRTCVAGAADLLWPPECCVCGRAGELFFCQSCRETLGIIEPPCCVRCGLPGVRSSCPDCGEAPWDKSRPCDAMRQIAVYEGAWREAIHRFKYDGMRCLAGELGRMLTDWLDAAPVSWREVDVVVAVPGRLLRCWEIGFYHARELGARVAAHLERPLVDPVKRLVGPSQMGLSREERLLNAKRLYGLRRRPEVLVGRRVLLIDDVVTTGATAQAVSALLKHSGAAHVRMLALARSV